MLDALCTGRISRPAAAVTAETGLRLKLGGDRLREGHELRPGALDAEGHVAVGVCLGLLAHLAYGLVFGFVAHAIDDYGQACPTDFTAVCFLLQP